MIETRKTRMTSRNKNKQTIKHSRKHTKKYTKKHPTLAEFPWYRMEYNLQPDRILDIVARRKSARHDYTQPPRTEFPGYRAPFYTFNREPPRRIVVIKSRWDDNLELNSLTDYFTEECRMTCRFGANKESPLEYWQRHRGEITSYLRGRGLTVNNYNVREWMYARNRLLYCNNFRVSVCLEVLDIFKPKRWLDISAGWGDRLLSALLSPWVEVYTGVDPNPCLHPGYKRMLETFNPKVNGEDIIIGSKKCTLIQDGFETAKLPRGIMYDLVFSSPPFFDLEVYSGAIADSLVQYKTVMDWFTGFLMPSIKKSLRYLVPGGYLVLYIAEAHGNEKYIPKMIEETDKLARNAGRFYYTDGAKLREFFCWQKIKN
jgi:hypothetical protein